MTLKSAFWKLLCLDSLKQTQIGLSSLSLLKGFAATWTALDGAFCMFFEDILNL